MLCDCPALAFILPVSGQGLFREKVGKKKTLAADMIALGETTACVREHTHQLG